jgi:hypothetical protein
VSRLTTSSSGDASGSPAPLEGVSDVLQQIKAQLFRLRARPLDVGPIDEIGVKDRGNGIAELYGSPRRAPFHVVLPAEQILERLSGLPDDGGPEVIRSELAQESWARLLVEPASRTGPYDRRPACALKSLKKLAVEESARAADT